MTGSFDDSEGYRQVLGVCEGAKEDGESWCQFLRHLKERGLQGVRLLTSDKCLGLVEALGEFYREADWQRHGSQPAAQTRPVLSGALHPRRKRR